ncbi:LOW QUALITY PROTEIN: hypothetical protein MARPO_0030s0097 [Marchantia polymorpha]|uniref:Uncharacterized protein n=1 Tax=Marchantia polymorpha TaxID=3197 RepID=A0A2R6X8D7_MARPO|nr:LOW QUALITY PROTEIN: hypothetical protein MARPO_0030s0097 [Marchantia polymorpha]|eukprot:PTQ42364.1 LOW QUALITY PROTEIN: hypothetical protein MARPO_0030s0097 [Marchantia polymorpha]
MKVLQRKQRTEFRLPAASRKGENQNQWIIEDDTSAAPEAKQAVMRALGLFEPGNRWSQYAGITLIVKNCFEPVLVKLSLNKMTDKMNMSRIEESFLLIFKLFGCMYRIRKKRSPKSLEHAVGISMSAIQMFLGLPNARITHIQMQIQSVFGK